MRRKNANVTYSLAQDRRTNVRGNDLGGLDRNPAEFQHEPFIRRILFSLQGTTRGDGSSGASAPLRASSWTLKGSDERRKVYRHLVRSATPVFSSESHETIYRGTEHKTEHKNSMPRSCGHAKVVDTHDDARPIPISLHRWYLGVCFVGVCYLQK